MQDINLKDELKKIQVTLDQQHLLETALKILHSESVEEQQIRQRIVSDGGKRSKWVGLEYLSDEHLFDLKAIEALCTRYRLRFLDSSLFKGEVPSEAIRRIKRLEASTGLRFEKFKVLAPADRFKLKDSTQDPMLLAELPNGKYYFIFQWGDDLKWYQEILKYPFRHMGTLTICALAFGALITLVVPKQFELAQAEFFYRFFMFSMSSALFLTLTIIAGILYSKDFSENVWNSKFIK